mmetsp:Transcript_39904/g.99891  ORF Transcript_39904/g.99891 Transcript_39904/m.99891 type:complete len:369 (+) Transcript_39904:57-1163(+)
MMRASSQAGAMLTLLFLFTVGILGPARCADEEGFESEEVDKEDLENWAKDGTGSNYVQKLVTDLENNAEMGSKRLVYFLKSGDDRLVKMMVSEEARGKQLQFLEAKDTIPLVLKMLGPHSPVHVKSKAAEAIKLLSLQNPRVGQMLGLHSWIPGMFGIRELILMITEASQQGADKTTMVAGEHALEALWALVQTSVDNLELAKSEGAIAACVDTIKSRASPRGKMWAAACLKSLFKDFYATPDGSYASAARRTIDNTRVRTFAVKDTQLVESLIGMAELGRVTETTPRSKWPSHATADERGAPSIMAWAAAGALGALGSGEDGSRELLQQRGVGALLCTLGESPDALEAIEAKAALQLLDEECSKKEL